MTAINRAVDWLNPNNKEKESLNNGSSFEGAEKVLTKLLEACRQARTAVELNNTLTAENSALQKENERLLSTNTNLKSTDETKRNADLDAEFERQRIKCADLDKRYGKLCATKTWTERSPILRQNYA